jgi:hypothetical protein
VIAQSIKQLALDWTVTVQFLAGSLATMFRTPVGSVQLFTGACSVGERQPKCDVDHSSVSNTKV